MESCMLAGLTSITPPPIGYPKAHRDAIVQMVMIAAERIGVDTTDDSCLQWCACGRSWKKLLNDNSKNNLETV